MSTKTQSEPLSAEDVRLLADLRGLSQAYASYPDVVVAAVERATQLISALPAEGSPTTPLALRFFADSPGSRK